MRRRDRFGGERDGDEDFERRVRRCVGADEELGEIERALEEARARHPGWRVVYAATPPVW